MEHVELQSLVTLGILLICGYFGGLLANLLKFPRVTGYITAGFLLSPSLSGIIPVEMVESRLSIVTDIALAIIAYSIGGSLNLSRLKQLGKSIFWINVSQSLGAFLVTFILIVLLCPYTVGVTQPYGAFKEVYLPLALILAAVSVATAPAAIMAIVHEYKAKGPLTTTLLAVVALDDGSAIILYAFVSTIVSALVKTEGISLYKMIAEPTIVISGSILLGAVFGFSLTRLASRIKAKESLLVVIIGHILLCAGIAEQLKLSPLLVNMTVGFFLINRAKHGMALFLPIERLEEPLFALFFTLAGAHLDINVMNTAGFMTLLIITGRFIGKFTGTKLSARLSHAPTVVTKYLGYCLLPKAGVTVGLILMAQPILQPEIYTIAINAVLASVIINELIAPPLVRFALIRSGEGIKG